MQMTMGSYGLPPQYHAAPAPRLEIPRRQDPAPYTDFSLSWGMPTDSSTVRLVGASTPQSVIAPTNAATTEWRALACPPAHSRSTRLSSLEHLSAAIDTEVVMPASASTSVSSTPLSDGWSPSAFGLPTGALHRTAMLASHEGSVHSSQPYPIDMQRSPQRSPVAMGDVSMCSDHDPLTPSPLGPYPCDPMSTSPLTPAGKLTCPRPRGVKLSFHLP